MKTTYTAHFEKGFMHGLAGVGRARTRKQILTDIVTEAQSFVQMSKGLQGRGDWCGAATKLISVSGLVEQGIDLAETLPGVRMIKTREQSDMARTRLTAVIKRLDVDPYVARDEVRACECGLLKAVEAVSLFASRLADEPVFKDGEELDFNEDLLIKEINKVAFGTRTPAEQRGVDHAQSVGERAGLFTTKPSESSVKNTTWHPEPGNPARERRWNPQTEKYEYRDKPYQGTGESVAAEKPSSDSDLNKFDAALAAIVKADIDVDQVREAAVNAAQDIHGKPDMELINGMIESAKLKAKDTEDAIQIVINMMRAE